MAVRGETMPRGARVGARVEAGGLDWLRHLWRWFKPGSAREREIGAMSQYGTWDPERERFRPMRADAAADLVAAQYGSTWSARIYGSSI